MSQEKKKMTFLSEAISFEAIKVALRQNDKGFLLSLSVHPDDIPEELIRDFVGARYAIAMVRVGDDERPLRRSKPNSFVQTAGILARDSQFQQWCCNQYGAENSEDGAVEAIHNVCQVGSRAELATNTSAQSMLMDLRRSFEEWKKS